MLLIRRVEHLKCCSLQACMPVCMSVSECVQRKIMAHIYQRFKRADDNLLGCNLNMQMTDTAGRK